MLYNLMRYTYIYTVISFWSKSCPRFALLSLCRWCRQEPSGNMARPAVETGLILS
jgi:hypothetical protein